MAQTLEYNSSISQVSAVTIPVFDEDMDIIQKLDDEPNDVGGLTANQLKAEFDAAGKRTQDYINNELIPVLISGALTEEARANAEAERVVNEQERVSNEEARVAKETSRITAEANRVLAENERDVAEQNRVIAEAARVSAEQARVDSTNGIVAQATAQANAAKTSADGAKASATAAASSATSASNSASNAASSASSAASSSSFASSSASAARAAQAAAEKARDEAQGAVGGDFATKTEAKGYANTAESNAKSYTDQKIAVIPTPDVSGQINTHNADTGAHSDIRQLIQQSAGYTKVQTLTDATKTLYGLGADAVPDDVLNAIKSLIDGANTNANSKAKIAKGTYKGTGKNGSSNKNSLSFDFEPKFLFVMRSIDFGNEDYMEQFLAINGTTKMQSLCGDSNRVEVVWSGNTVSWYAANAHNQLNDSGKQYSYVAIG